MTSVADSTLEGRGPQMSTLLQQIRAASARALSLGTLKPIETESTYLSGVPPSHSTAPSHPFLVRVVHSLKQKDAASNHQKDPTASAKGKPDFNPFLPYEPSMHVRDLPPSHVLLLNKFPVVADHALIVTSAFEEQSSLLTAADFRALWDCLSQGDAVAFYNAGRIAGASQRHKHLQIVAGPLGDLASPHLLTPFDTTLGAGAEAAPSGELFSADGLRFVHAAVGMEDVAHLAAGGDAGAAAAETMRRYLRMLHGMGEVCAGGVDRPFAYNLVVTGRWMLMVPRRVECFEEVSVNALGFVGCLLVRGNEGLETVRRVGGMTVLRHVGFDV